MGPKIGAIFICLSIVSFSGATPKQELEGRFEGGKVKPINQEAVFAGDEIREVAKGLISSDSAIRSESQDRYDSLPPRMRKKVASELIISLDGKAPRDQSYQYAVAALKKTKVTLVVAAACELIDGADSGVQSVAVDVLSLAPSKAVDALSTLRAAAISQKKEYVRSGAFKALSEILRDSDMKENDSEFQKTLDVFAAGMRDKNRSIRTSAFLYVIGLGPKAKAIIPLLIEGLRDPSDDVRRTAASSLGSIDSEGKSVAALAQVLKDEQSLVRRNATISLSRIGLDSAIPVPQLIEALEDSEEYIRRYAAEALGRRKKLAGGAIPILNKLIDQDRSEEVRNAAAIALKRIEDTSERE